MSLVVKICGLSTPEALDVALDAGADMVGFVFFAPSPRHVAFATARALGERVRGRAKKVALSVDADDALLDAVVEALRPDLLQLHGKETPARLAALRARFGLPVMKAIAGRSEGRPRRRRDLQSLSRPPAVRCPRAARGDAAGRARQSVRLAPPGKSRSRPAVHALGRARCRQCRRGAMHHPRARASTSPRASSARRAKRILIRSALSSAPRGRRRRAR